MSLGLSIQPSFLLPRFCSNIMHISNPAKETSLRRLRDAKSSNLQKMICVKHILRPITTADKKKQNDGKVHWEVVQTRGKNFPKRGEVYWVNLDSARGAETQKKRPGLIVSNDIGNEVSRLVLVAPITSKVKHVYPFEVKTVIRGKTAKIMLNQCRVSDKSRLLGKIGVIDSRTINAVNEAIKIVFSIN